MDPSEAQGTPPGSLPGTSQHPAGGDLGYVIPSERMPEALARLEPMYDFLAQIEALGLSLEPPSIWFDPSWDDR